MIIDFIGMPLFLGASTAGMELGPKMIRRVSLEKIFCSHEFTDKGDVVCADCADMRIPVMKNVFPILDADARLADEVYESLSQKHFPLIFGGDHSLSWGSIAGATRAYSDLSVIYIDAHGDFNTAETSETHNVHGMHMAYLMGLGSINEQVEVPTHFMGSVCPQSVYFIGSRALDEGEIAFSKEYQMHVATTQDVKQKGWHVVAENVINDLHLKGAQHVHVSLDIDVMDPMLVPGTGVPEKNGLHLDEVNGLLSHFLKSLPVSSLDLVEYNPRLDTDEKTYDVCVELLKTINDSLLDKI